MPRKSKVKREDKIESTYKTMFRFQCPVRGWVEEEVTVVRYKPQDAYNTELSVASLYKKLKIEDREEEEVDEA